MALEVGAAEALGRLLTGIREGEDPSTIRTAFDELDELLRRGGIPGGLSPYQGRSSGGYPRLPISGNAVEEVFACPAGTCPRAEAVLDIGARPPRCGVYGERMHRVRLDR
ncbi:MULTISPECIES: hypothetical protein [Streptomyces]|uniref:hypothetical protein n=1 Tax=Streptomyces lycopersici TaxID=2974589 RepID=UPI0021CE2A63|nr:hypothetical protein [Streptomyces sp. NEAU-383]